MLACKWCECSLTSPSTFIVLNFGWSIGHVLEKLSFFVNNSTHLIATLNWWQPQHSADEQDGIAKDDRQEEGPHHQHCLSVCSHRMSFPDCVLCHQGNWWLKWMSLAYYGSYFLLWYWNMVKHWWCFVTTTYHLRYEGRMEVLVEFT